MDAFFGSWKMVSKVHFDEYMAAIGLPDTMKQYINNIEGVVRYSQDGDNIVMKIKMFGTIDKSHTYSFKLGEEFDEVSIDLRSCKSVFNLEGGKLIQLQKWDGKVVKIVSEIQDGKMTLSLIFGDVVSVVTYERI